MYDKDLLDDVVIVGINPIIRHTLPRSPEAISNWINEIGFNASLLAELRSIAFVRDLLDTGVMQPGMM